MYILPSSFINSPRYMHKLFQDAMSVVRVFGKPDLFITFTCNPYWVEIKRELLSGQVPADRPDLLLRKFKSIFLNVHARTCTFVYVHVHMIVHDQSWSFMINHDRSWSIMIVYDQSWSFVYVHSPIDNGSYKINSYA